MPVIVQKITEPLTLGEGPHWDDRQQALFFVSILDWTIHKYLPSTGEHTKTKLNSHVSFIIPIDGTTDQFVVGMDRKFQIIRWDGKNNSPVKILKELFEVDHDKPANKINDGKIDPRGRLYAGTLGIEAVPGAKDGLDTVRRQAGSLYCIEGDNIAKMDSGINLSNGLAWDLGEKAMYYVDSLEYNVRRYDYDVETGVLSNMKHIFDTKKNGLSGLGDGMTIDTDGNLWLAMFGDSCVVKIDPKTGTILQKVEIPAAQVTSVTFGGRDLGTLFVTTGNMPISAKQKPPNGCVFRVTGLGVKGHPNLIFKL